MIIYHTREGDTLDSIAFEFYGYLNAELLRAVYAANQNIGDYEQPFSQGIVVISPDIEPPGIEEVEQRKLTSGVIVLLLYQLDYHARLKKDVRLILVSVVFVRWHDLVDLSCEPGDDCLLFHESIVGTSGSCVFGRGFQSIINSVNSIGCQRDCGSVANKVYSKSVVWVPLPACENAV